MPETVHSESLLEDLADQWNVRDDVSDATVVDMTAGKAQKQTNSFLVRDFESDPKFGAFTNRDPEVPYPYTDYGSWDPDSEFIPDGFEECSFSAVQQEPYRITCPRCDGDVWKPHDCDDHTECNDCYGNGMIKCSCGDGKMTVHDSGELTFQVFEGKTGVARNGDVIPNHVVGDADGEFEGETIDVYRHDDSIPPGVKATARALDCFEDGDDIEARVVKHRKRIYTVPFVRLDLEYDGDEYTVYRADEEWHLPDSLLEHIGSDSYHRMELAFTILGTAAKWSVFLLGCYLVYAFVT